MGMMRGSYWAHEIGLEHMKMSETRVRKERDESLASKGGVPEPYLTGIGDASSVEP